MEPATKRRRVGPRRSKAWCFTSFEEEEPTYVEEKMRWLIYAPELSPTTGRKHWQGFVYFKNPQQMSGVKRMLGASCHVEVKARGSTFGDQKTYIQGPYSKDGKEKPLNPEFTEFGVMPAQGARGDLKGLAAAVVSGEKSVREILLEDPDAYHQYGRTLQDLEDAVSTESYRTWMTEGLWLYGGTGSGKSTKAFAGFDPATHFVYTPDGRWWDGYQGHPIVIIDDFRGKIPYDMLLRLVDQWPCQVPRRGRRPAQFLARRVIITSPLTPEEVYHNRAEKDGIEQLLRRFTVVRMEDGEGCERTQPGFVLPSSEIDLT